MLESLKKLRIPFTILFAIIMVPATMFAGLSGRVDRTFSGDGKANLATTMATASDFGRDIAVQPDGKIVVVGQLSGASIDFVVMRLNRDGSLDTSFDGDGKVTTDFDGNSDDAYSVVILPDGKILVAGYAVIGGGFADFAVVRYNANGSLDTTFDGDGKVTTDFASEIDTAAKVIVQADGKYLVLGRTRLPVSFTQKFAAVRYNTNGSLDTTFDGDGRVTVPVTSGSDTLFGGLLQNNQRIVMVGNAGADWGIARLLPSGAIDTSFSDDGVITLDMAGFPDTAYNVAQQANNRLVIVGSSGASGGAQDFGIARFLVDGTPDTSFNTTGKLVLAFGTGNFDLCNGIEIQSDGYLLMTGTSNTSGNHDFAVAKLRPEGELDLNFNGTGKTTIDFFGRGDFAGESVLQPDGKLLIVGNAGVAASDDDIGIARVNTVTKNAPFDYDGDEKADVSIYRPSLGQWWLNRSTAGTIAATFGVSTDKMVPADYTGDSKTDVAFFRPSTGEWYVLRSEDSSFYAAPFGTSTDVPVPGDYDGDGKADIAVFRPSTVTWFINNSGGGTTILPFGAAGDVPVAADYDGDNKTDIAIYRPSVGQWWMNRSTAGLLAVTFGSSSDKTVQGDYTGDGKADVAFWRPSNGNWFVLRSEDFSFYGFPFGATTDVPTVGDFDGDGQSDAAVFRPSNSTWFVNGTQAGNYSVPFGTTGDLPTPNAFVR